MLPRPRRQRAIVRLRLQFVLVCRCPRHPMRSISGIAGRANWGRRHAESVMLGALTLLPTIPPSSWGISHRGSGPPHSCARAGGCHTYTPLSGQDMYLAGWGVPQSDKWGKCVNTQGVCLQRHPSEAPCTEVPPCDDTCENSAEKLGLQLRASRSIRHSEG